MHLAFLLQPNFSLLAFTAAADALTTANLVLPSAAYQFSTISTGDQRIHSDLGIGLVADRTIQQAPDSSVDGLVVCGGYRCNLTADPELSTWLTQASEQSTFLGSLWNGVFALAHAGLMNGFQCAVHPDNAEAAQATFPRMQVLHRPVVLDRGRLSAAGPNSALDLMLALIQRQHDAEVVGKVRGILRADDPSPNATAEALFRDAEQHLPQALQTALQLMRNNIDETLTRDELARYLGLSSRGIERLFQRHLATSPTRHYLGIRLQRAHELLISSDEPVASVADACGFVSAAHFSRSFSQHFGYSPRTARRQRD